MTLPVAAPERARTWVRHALVVLVGLVVLAYPFTLGQTPEVACRGVRMQPGDVCRKADGSGTQTYEQRAGAVRNARPVIAAGGLLVTAFGTGLLVGELRRRRRPAG